MSFSCPRVVILCGSSMWVACLHNAYNVSLLVMFLFRSISVWDIGWRCIEKVGTSISMFVISCRIDRYVYSPLGCLCFVESFLSMVGFLWMLFCGPSSIVFWTVFGILCLGTRMFFWTQWWFQWEFVVWMACWAMVEKLQWRMILKQVYVVCFVL